MMAVYGGVSTVRLPTEVRGRLKTTAAARGLTMELALCEAVELWVVHGGTLRRSGRVTEEAKRMRAQVEQVADSGNQRVIAAAMVVLDGLVLQV